MAIWITIATTAMIIIANLVFAFRDRRPETVSSWSSDPKQHGWLLIGVSVSGSIVGGGMFLAVGQIGFEAGIIGVAIGFVYLVALAIIGIFAGRFRGALAAKSVTTLLDLYRAHYGDVAALIYAILNVTIYFFLLAAQFLGIFVVADYLGAEMNVPFAGYASLVALVVISIATYPVIGGARRDIRTDLFQGIAVAGSALIIMVAILVSSPSMFARDLEPYHLTGLAYGPSFLIGLLVFVGPALLVRFDLWQRLVAARTTRDARYGFFLAALISFMAFSIFAYVGASGYQASVKSAQSATLDVVRLIIDHPLFLGIVLGGLFSAVLSSADTFLNNATLNLHGIVRFCRRGKVGDAGSGLLNLRILAATVLALSIMTAYLVPNFVDLFVAAFSIVLVFLPPLVASLLNKWMSKSGAIFAPLVGFVVFIMAFFGLFQVVGISTKTAFVPGVIAALVCYVSCLLVDGGDGYNVRGAEGSARLDR